MFTGLIETLGTVASITNTGDGRRLVITPAAPFDDVKVGDSIAVDGVCLTVNLISDNSFQVFAVAETLARSTLNSLRTGTQVNLERALKVGSRLGGHFVSGHVDCVGEILSDTKKGDSLERRIRIDEQYMRHIAEKGSVTVDGVSLTVAARDTGGFSVALIPHTLEVTTLRNKKTGDSVNIETDILAKYVETIIGGAKEPMTLKALQDMGF